jgi:hypothetical protein
VPDSQKLLAQLQPLGGEIPITGKHPNYTELATKMENKSKRHQVITYNIHPQER